MIFNNASLTENQPLRTHRFRFTSLHSSIVTIHANPVQTIEHQSSSLKELWNQAVQNDDVYECAVDTIWQEKQTFSHDLELKISTNECSLNAQGRLRFHGRLWVSRLEELRTKMMQETHDFKACGHSGRDNTCQILERQYFWPGMSQDVRRFVRRLANRVRVPGPGSGVGRVWAE